MEEGDLDWKPKPKVSFEDKLGPYKNRMEFMRTMIGFVVLGIQVFIMYHLSKSK